MSFDLITGATDIHPTSDEFKRHMPTTLFCTEVGVGECCPDCHARELRIRVYPHTCYSEGQKSPKPDIGMGIHAEVCCGRYHAVRELPRSFWLQRYGVKHGWKQADIDELIRATPQEFFKTQGRIASRYYVASPSSAGSVHTGRSSKSYSRNVGGVSRKTTASKCPACGQRWNGEVCDNCGHGGGI